MREAVGGSLLFYIILGFLAVYIVFIGVIINYAATYRASNYVLTKLEQTEGNISLGDENSIDPETLYGAVRSKKYYNKLSVCCKNVGNGAVFRITTNVNFKLPLIGSNLKLYINNETKTIYNVSCSETSYFSNICN